MYRIHVTKVRDGNFPRQVFTAELSTGSEPEAKYLLSLFRNKFPTPHWSCCLTRTKTTTETLSPHD